jgi:hypothetical protein
MRAGFFIDDPDSGISVRVQFIAEDENFLWTKLNANPATLASFRLDHRSNCMGFLFFRRSYLEIEHGCPSPILYLEQSAHPVPLPPGHREPSPLSRKNRYSLKASGIQRRFVISLFS